MELHQLRAFVTVAEEGSVTRAAERLYASQPAVSGQIKALEQHLGVSLFRRSAAGMILTDEGQSLIHHAHRVLRSAEQLQATAERSQQASAASLVLGINNMSPALFPIDDVIGRLVGLLPGLNLQLEHAPSGTVLRGIRKQKIDVGFAEGDIHDPSLQTLRIGTTRLCIAVPVDWRDRCGEHDWSRLENVPWAFTSPDCSYHRLFEQVASEHQLTLQTQFRVDHDGTAVSFVRRGLAVSMIDRPNAEAAERDGHVYIWPGFEAELPIGLHCLKSRADEPGVAALYDVCRQMARAPLPGNAGG